MRKILDINTNLSLWLNNISMIAIMAMALLVVINVILRAFPLTLPIMGTYEYVRLLQMVIIGGSIAYCAVLGGHVSVDFLVNKLPVKISKFIDTIMGIISTIFLFFASYYVFQFGYSFKMSGEVTETTGMPFYPFVWFVSFALLVFAIVELKNIVNRGDVK